LEIQTKNFLPEKTYPFKFSLLLSLAFSIIFGMVSTFLVSNASFSLKLIYSFAFGVVAFFVPSILSVIFVKLVRKKSELRHLSFISLVGMSGYAISFIISLFARNLVKESIIIGLSVGNSLVLISWFIGLKILLRSRKALPLCLVHPTFNILSFSIIGSSLWVITPYLIFKLYLSIAVFFIISEVLFYLLNAPMKRNLGVSSMDLLVSFFGSRVTREDIFGKLMEKIGEKVTTYVELIIFKTKKGIKTTFVIPGIHFGPFGSAGGSDYPYLLGKGNRIVFHSLTTHDYNPIYKKDYKIIEKIIKEEEKRAMNLKAYPKGNFFEIGSRERLIAIKFGKDYFFTLTRAPLVTEDVEESVNLLLENKAKILGARNAFFVDAHNCRELGQIASEVHLGSDIARSYEKLLEEAIKKKIKEEKLKVGFSHVQTKEAKDLGKGGIKVAVLKFGKKGIALIVIDGNNMLPRLRAEIIGEVKENFKLEAEVYTTDTHEVQKSGEKEVYVGEFTSANYLKRKVKEAIKKALENLEEASVLFSKREFEIMIWGEGKENEIVATINSILALFRIIAPAFVFISMLIIAVLIWAI
jgi:putative membrane protein